MWQPPERIKYRLPQTSWPSEEDAAASKLFSPVRIGPVHASQRTWVPAMVPWRATDDGFVSQDVLDWYGRFADGQPGVVVVEATGIRDIPSGPLLRIGHDRFVPQLKQLTDAVRKRSDGQTKLFLQCIDFLAVKRRPPKQKFIERFLVVRDYHRDALRELDSDDSWSGAAVDRVRGRLLELDDDTLARVLDAREASDLFYGYRERVWDMHLEHIRALPEILPGLFADAAERAFAAGFDGIELHYAHAYTMASFLSALNTRDDGYGGTRDHRVRLPLEVIDAVRARVGVDRCVGVRFLGDEVIDGGSRLEDAIFFGVEMAGRGIDFLSISKGGKFEDAKRPKVGDAVYPYTGRSGYECMPTIYSDATGPFGRNVPLGAAIRAALRAAGHEIPLVIAGGIGTFEMAEGILQRGEADIIGAARQTLADPDWFRKARLGRGSDIRRCEYTNYCEALDQKHKAVTCKLWDRQALDEPGVRLDPRGKRRLVAPKSSD